MALVIIIYFFLIILNVLQRRWFVLTNDALYSFKEEKSYKSPTEVI